MDWRLTTLLLALVYTLYIPTSTVATPLSGAFASYTPSCPASQAETGDTGSFGFGANGGPGYTASSDCYWVIDITASGSNRMNISFNFFDTEATDDYVELFIWKDASPPASASIAKFSGTSIPAVLDVPSHFLVVKFHSDGDVTLGDGFGLDYAAQGETLSENCGGLQTFTEAIGFISDQGTGGQGSDYASLSDCRFQITNADSYILISFLNMTLGSGDFVRFYTGTTVNKANLLAVRTGSDTTPVYGGTTETNILIQFTSNGVSEDDGFYLGYGTSVSTHGTTITSATKGQYYTDTTGAWSGSAFYNVQFKLTTAGHAIKVYFLRGDLGATDTDLSVNNAYDLAKTYYYFDSFETIPQEITFLTNALSFTALVGTGQTTAGIHFLWEQIPISACGVETLSTNTGYKEITLPPNTNCAWSLTAPAIRIIVSEYLKMEGEAVIEWFDGSNSNAAAYARRSSLYTSFGTDLIGPMVDLNSAGFMLTSPGNAYLVASTGSGSLTYRFKWVGGADAACPDSLELSQQARHPQATSPKAVVPTTRTFATYVPNGGNCTWIITIPGAEQINLEIMIGDDDNNDAKFHAGGDASGTVLQSSYEPATTYTWTESKITVNVQPTIATLSLIFSFFETATTASACPGSGAGATTTIPKKVFTWSNMGAGTGECVWKIDVAPRRVRVTTKPPKDYPTASGPATLYSSTTYPGSNPIAVAPHRHQISEIVTSGQAMLTLAYGSTSATFQYIVKYFAGQNTLSLGASTTWTTTTVTVDIELITYVFPGWSLKISLPSDFASLGAPSGDFIIGGHSISGKTMTITFGDYQYPLDNLEVTFDVKTPTVSGATGTFSVSIVDEAGADVDPDTSVASITITPGALSGASLAFSSSASGATGVVCTVQFTTRTPLIAGDKIRVTFPAGFTVPNAGETIGGHVNIATSGSSLKFSATEVGVTLSAPIATSTAVTFTLPGFTLPGAGGVTATFTIETLSTSNVVRDQLTGVAGVRLTGDLSSVGATPSVSTVRTPGSIAFTFVTEQAMSSGDKIEIDIPATYDVTTGQTLSSVSGFTPNPSTGTFSSSTLIVTVGAGGVSAGGTVSFTYPGFTTPTAVATTSGFTFRTKLSGGDVLDLGSDTGDAMGVATLTAATMTPATGVVYALETVTLSLTTVTKLTSGDQIRVVFPAGFVVPASGTTYSGTGVTLGSATKSTQTLIIPVASTVNPGATISVSITGVRLPAEEGTTTDYTVTTRFGSSVTHQSKTATGSTITVGSLGTVSLTASPLTAYALSTVDFSITITAPLVANDRIYMTFQTGFIPPNNQAVTNMGGGMSTAATTSATGDTMYIVVDTTIAAGSTLTFRVANFRNPAITGTTSDMALVKTTRSDGTTKRDTRNSFSGNTDITITDGTLGTTTATPNVLTSYASASIAFSVTTNSPLVSGDKITIACPADMGIPTSVAVTGASGAFSTGINAVGASNLVTVVLNSGWASGAVGGFTISGFTLPPQVGSAFSLTVITRRTDNVIRDTIVLNGPWTQTAGALTTPVIGLTDYDKGDLTDVAVVFTNKSPILNGDKVVVTFPAQFTVPATPALDSQSNIALTTPASASGQVVTMTVTGGTVATGTVVSFNIEGLTLANTAGLTGTFTIETKTSSNVVRDSGTAGAVRIQGAIANMAVTPASSVYLSEGGCTIQLRTDQAIDNGGSVIVQMPGFGLTTGLTPTGVSGGSIVGNGQVASVYLKVITTGISANTLFTFTYPDCVTPLPGNTGAFAFTTYMASTTVADNGNLAAPTLTMSDMAPSSVIPQALTSYSLTNAIVTFTTTALILNGDIIEVHFPTGTTIASPGGAYSVTGTGLAVATASVSGLVVSIPISSNVGMGVTCTIDITGVRIRDYSGPTGTYKIRVKNSGTDLYAFKDDVAGQTITPASLAVSLDTITVPTAYGVTSLTFSITVTSPLANGDSVYIDMIDDNSWSIPSAQTLGSVTGFTAGSTVSQTGKRWAFSITGTVTAGATMTFTIPNVRNPSVSGPLGIITSTFSVAGNAVRDEDYTGTITTITAGSLTSVSVPTTGTPAYTYQTMTIQFTTNCPVSSGDTLTIDFPAGYDLPATPSMSPTGFTCSTGSTTGQTMSVTITSPIGTGTPVSMVIDEQIRLPDAIGSAGSYSITISNSTGVERDSGTVASETIIPRINITNADYFPDTTAKEILIQTQTRQIFLTIYGTDWVLPFAAGELTALQNAISGSASFNTQVRPTIAASRLSARVLRVDLGPAAAYDSGVSDTIAMSLPDSLWVGTGSALAATFDIVRVDVDLAFTPAQPVACTEGTDTEYYVALSIEPASDVTITAVNFAPYVTIAPLNLYFTNGDWSVPQTMTISAVEDNVDIGSSRAHTVNHTSTTADPIFAALPETSLDITIADNDVAGLTISLSGGPLAEGSGPGYLWVNLDTEPQHDVLIFPTNIAEVDWTTGAPSLVFGAANYSTPQNFTVLPVDDSAATGTKTVTLTVTAGSVDTYYNGLADSLTNVPITDDDVTITIQAATIAEVAIGDPARTIPAAITVPEPVPAVAIASITLTSTSATNMFSVAPALGNFVAGPPGTATLTFTPSATIAGQWTGRVDVTLVNGASSSQAVQIPVLAAHTPSISSFTPTAGSTQSPTLVTISGQFLTGPNLVVLVGGKPCTITGVPTATSIQCSTTLDGVTDGTSGAVQVTNDNGSGSGGTFAFYNPGEVTGINPASTRSRVATKVTITGSNLVTGAGDLGTISLAGVPCTTDSTSFVSTSEITCTTGLTIGSKVGAVVVTPARGVASTGTTTFRYIAPSVLLLSPNKGSPQGGTTVLLQGSGFGTETTDLFNASLAGVWCDTVTRASDNLLTCVTRPAAENTTGPVLVKTTLGGEATSPVTFTYFDDKKPPTVSGFTPTSGSVGTKVVITGTNFGATSTELEGVAIGGAPCPHTYIDATTVECTASNNTNTGKVTVTTTHGTATSTADFTFATPIVEGFAVPRPSVVKINPSGGSVTGGNLVTITGEGLGENADDVASITLAGVTCYPGFKYVSPNELVCQSRKGDKIGKGPVIVTTVSGGDSNDNVVWSYTKPGPHIEGAFPRQGRRVGGTVITYIGTNFGKYPAESIELFIGGRPCTQSTWISDTEATCVIPPESLKSSRTVVQPGEVYMRVNGTLQSNFVITTFAYFDDPDICDPTCPFRADCVSGQCACVNGFFGPPACEGLRVTLNALDTETSESGDTGSISVKLGSQPSAPVTITTSIADTSEARQFAPLVISPDKWDADNNLLIITGVRDRLRDGNIPFDITFNPTQSEDPLFNGVRIEDSFEFVNMESPPVITLLNPSTSPLNGTRMTIEGTDFDYPVKVIIRRKNDKWTDIHVFGMADLLHGAADDPKFDSNETLITPSGQRILEHTSLYGESSHSDMSDSGLHLLAASDSTTGLDKIVFRSPRLDQDEYEIHFENRDGTTANNPRALLYTDDCPEKGFWGRGADCQPCPSCGTCPGGYRIIPKAGCWGGTTAGLSGKGEDLVQQCRPAERCLGGSNNTCAEGYEGAFCAECADGFYPLNDICEVCPADEGQTILVIVSICMWLTYAMAGTFIEDKENFSHLLAMILALQSVGGIGSMLPAKGIPKWVRAMYEVFTIFAADIKFLKPDCSGQVNFEQNYAIKLGYNIGTGIPFFLALLITRYVAYRLRQKDGEFTAQKRWEHYTDRITRAVSIHLTIVYLAVTTNSFEAIACQAKGGSWRTITNPAHMCWSVDHSLVSGASYLILIFFTVGFPLWQAWWQWKHDDVLYTGYRYMHQFDYLYDPFIATFKYYWLFEFVASFTIAVGDTMLVEVPEAQFGIVVFPLVIHLIILCAKRPFRRGWENPTMIGITIANITGMILALLGNLDMAEGQPGLVLGLSWVMAVCVSLTSLVYVLVMFYYLGWVWVPRTVYDEEEAGEFDTLGFSDKEISKLGRASVYNNYGAMSQEDIVRMSLGNIGDVNGSLPAGETDGAPELFHSAKELPPWDPANQYNNQDGAGERDGDEAILAEESIGLSLGDYLDTMMDTMRNSFSYLPGLTSDQDPSSDDAELEAAEAGGVTPVDGEPMHEEGDVGMVRENSAATYYADAEQGDVDMGETVYADNLMHDLVDDEPW